MENFTIVSSRTPPSGKRNYDSFNGSSSNSNSNINSNSNNNTLQVQLLQSLCASVSDLSNNIKQLSQTIIQHSPQQPPPPPPPPPPQNI